MRFSNPFKRASGGAAKERRMPIFGRRAYDPASDEIAAPALAAAGGSLPPPPDHGAARAADPYSYASAHRRLAWLLRLSVATNVTLGAVAIVLAAAIGELVPLKTTEIALVRIEPTTDELKAVDPTTRVRIEPLTRTVQGYDLAMQAFARRYVTLIKPIDAVSQEWRMVEARRYTDGTYWEKGDGKEKIGFASKLKADFDEAIKDGMTRSVVVETATRLPSFGQNALYAVDYKQVDRVGKNETVQLGRAFLTVTTREQTVGEAERFDNPLGFRVLAFSAQPRGNS